MVTIKNLLLSGAMMLTASFTAQQAYAQGWPEHYSGVMLQGFSWDSYENTAWKTLTAQADELGQYFSLVWVPQSGNCGGTSMGYNPLYWFPGDNHYSSSFGSEEQLRTMIATFREHGIGTIADVVINHRGNVSTAIDFPVETYKGVTYSMSTTDICANDDGGAIREAYPSMTFGANDSGEAWPGMRDLDHSSANVQRCVNAYLDMLLHDLGYVGFRYDMVKGYAARYTGLYNETAAPTFSVGEYWDGNSAALKNWLNGTKRNDVIQSAAFDFKLRYTARDAFNNNNWSRLATGGLVNETGYDRYAVTFVENHDMQDRGNVTNYTKDPINQHVAAANAYLLAMPGTPCVFQPHWLQYKAEIKRMIEARHMAGLHNQSAVNMDYAHGTGYWVIKTTGDRASLLAVLGTGCRNYTIPTGYVEVCSGESYRYLMERSAEQPWVSTPGGIYTEGQQVQLTAVSPTATTLVYTTDGTAPTATNGTQVPSGTTITLPDASTTLQVALLAGTEVRGTQTYHYVIEQPAQPTTVETIPAQCQLAEGEQGAFFEAPAAWVSTIMCWSWNLSSGTVHTGTSWPGTACTYVCDAPSGNAVWKWTYSGTRTLGDHQEGIIFSNSGSPQTSDMQFVNGGYYTRDGLLGVYDPAAGIDGIAADTRQQTDGAEYNLAGQRVGSSYHGIVIKNGRKVIK